MENIKLPVLTLNAIDLRDETTDKKESRASGDNDFKLTTSLFADVNLITIRLGKTFFELIFNDLAKESTIIECTIFFLK
jgi:hypothetical protein